MHQREQQIKVPKPLCDGQTLVSQIIDGHKPAEQALVERYWRGLYFILSRRSQDPDLAADIAQDTFIVVIAKARNGEVKNPAALKAFIRQVGVNLLIAHYRKTSRRDTQSVADLDIQVPDDSPDVYRKLYSENIVKLVRQLIDELKEPRDREILISYFVYDKDKAEICIALALSADNFDKVLYRARKRLKQLIEHKLNDEPGVNGTKVAGAADILLFMLMILGGVEATTNTGDDALDNHHLKNILLAVEESDIQQHLDNQVMRTNNFKPLAEQRNIPRGS
ncbi:MAG: RNA polymerase sigma factor (sigma-70 family) [Phenylobacterium sp.]|jgi:RNA polymerase sigma factor (sigma-70 family)